MDAAQRKKTRKPMNIGLLARRIVVFSLPALVIVGAVAVNVVSGAFAPKPDEKEEIVKATPVVVAVAERQNTRLMVRAQGEAAPRTEIDVIAEVSGKIIEVSPAFIEGGAFEEGDVLIRIASDEFAYRVTQAKANVAQAESRYASERAEANIAKAELDELGIEERSALALRQPQLAEAAAMLSSARAALNEAELQMARTVIRAPFKGRVLTRTADLGQFATPGVSLGRIFSTDIIEVALPITDAELGQLGLPVGFRETADDLGPEVTLSALVGGAPRAWRGRITRTGNGYDRETRVIFAYAEVADPYGAGADNGAPLAAGLFVNAEIEGRAVNSSIVVPRAALRGEDRVYVATADDTLEIRNVAVASSNRQRAVLLSGLEAGERVIISPVRGAADGIPLAIAGDGAVEENDEEAAAVANATN
ncbi:MAG: efflux RND transporter periplasmic adaptor subunit [Pseudomonadota bacterium]